MTLPFNPPIHIPIGGSVSTNHKSSNRIELSQLNMINMDASMGWPFAISYDIFLVLCMCICMCVCVCVYTCACEYMWRHPETYPDLPLPNRARGPEISKNAIKLECIEIIQFCLKICDFWTLLHFYRIGLVCRWGSYHKKHIFTFGPKKLHVFCSCEPPDKNFLFYTLKTDKPFLD